MIKVGDIHPIAYTHLYDMYCQIFGAAEFESLK